jgi:MFS family permease
MKTISIWASKNQNLAIAFIIIIELLKGLMGFAIGNDFLPILSNATIELSVLAIVFIISFVQINYRHYAPELTKEKYYKFRIKSTAIIFLSSFLLAILLGNHFKNVGYLVSNQLISYAGVTIKTDSVQQQEGLTIFEKTIKKNQSNHKKHQLFSKQSTENSTNDTGKRIGYVLLFMLSLILSYFGLALSCSIACSGYGVLAILAILLTLGIFSGGIYFLIKSFRKTIKPSKEMTHEEKKKERKKFFAIWGIVTAIAALLIIISNSSN